MASVRQGQARVSTATMLMVGMPGVLLGLATGYRALSQKDLAATGMSTVERRFIVTSSGLEGPMTREFSRMLGGRPANMWYVPTASLVDARSGPMPDWVAQRAGTLRQSLGLQTVRALDPARLTSADLERELSALPSVDAVYLEGGNTYYLRHHLRQSGADGLLLSYVARGAVIVGVSAGSIVLGKTVQTAFWKDWDDRTGGGSLQEDWEDPAVSSGLDLLDGRAVLPHAEGEYATLEWQRAQRARCGHESLEVIILSDSEALVVEGTKSWRVRASSL